MAVSHRVAPVLQISIEDTQEWVKDQLLEIACDHLLSIRFPEAWWSYVDKAVYNRALSVSRRSTFKIEYCETGLQDIPAPDDSLPDADDDMDDLVLNDSLDMFYRLSYRDRAIMKLAFCIMPSNTEWHGLAIATDKNPDDLKPHFNQWFLNSDLDVTDHETELAAIYLKIIKRLIRLNRLKRELDHICLVSAPDQDAEQHLINRIEQETAASNRLYQRYLNLQKPVRRRIPVMAIADATGLTESDIYQIISRARRKIRNASS